MRTPGVTPRQAATYASAADLIASGWRGETETCRCGALRAAHTGARHTGPNKATRCTRYARDEAEQAAQVALAAACSNPVRDVATVYALSSPARKSLHASDAGACPRSLWYRINPPPGYVPAPVDTDAATMGSIDHREIAAARAHLYRWREYERAVTIPGIAEEESHIDQWDPLLGRVSDIKTCDEWKWEQIEVDPWPKDVAQVLTYGYCLTAEGKVVLDLELEYVHRATGKVRRHLIAYDHAAATAEVGILRAQAAALDAGLELPRGAGFDGPTHNVICRDWCPARMHCWNVEAAEAADRSAESYTVVGPDPRENEPVTAWALATFDERKHTYQKATKEYEVARTLLRGIPGGRYTTTDGTSWAYADDSRPSANTSGYQSDITRTWLAWLEDPDRDPAVLIARLSGVHKRKKNEFRPTVKLAPQAAHAV